MELKKYTVTEMEVKDLDEVLCIESLSSQHPWSKNMFIDEMSNPFSHCFVIKNEDSSKKHVMGYICFRIIKDESDLLNIAVHPQHRRSGIGKKLMQFYTDFCKQRQIKTFYLEVNASNSSAVHLYQFFSYQPVGVRKRFYQGKFDALLMEKRP